MPKKQYEKDQNAIVVDGTRIATEVKLIDITELRYWRENPRVDSIVRQRFPDGKATDEDIEKELWALDSVKELFQDIKKNGGLIDEILVKGDQVLEGNSRLCAYRQLYKRATSDDEKLNWLGIRARVIPDATSSEAIFAILGTWHIKGKAEWKTFEKASYITRIHREHGKTTKEIATLLKRPEAEVKNMIETYDHMQRKGITETQEQRKFSAVYEIVKNRDMKKLHVEEPELHEACLDAVKEGRFDRAEAVRDLPKIMRDKKARRAFLDEHLPIEEAAEIAKGRHPEHADSFYRILKRATAALEECPASRIEEIKDDGNKSHALRKLYRAVSKVLKQAGVRPD
jgi:hypothetical protein